MATLQVSPDEWEIEYVPPKSQESAIGQEWEIERWGNKPTQSKKFIGPPKPPLYEVRNQVAKISKRLAQATQQAKKAKQPFPAFDRMSRKNFKWLADLFTGLAQKASLPPEMYFAPMRTKEYWQETLPTLKEQARDFTADLAKRAGFPLPPGGVSFQEWTRPYKSVMEPKKSIIDIAKEKGKVLEGLATYIPKTVLELLSDPVGMIRERPLDAAFIGSLMIGKGGKPVVEHIKETKPWQRAKPPEVKPPLSEIEQIKAFEQAGKVEELPPGTAYLEGFPEEVGAPPVKAPKEKPLTREQITKAKLPPEVESRLKAAEADAMKELYMGYPLIKEIKQSFKRTLKGMTGTTLVDIPPPETVKDVAAKTKIVTEETPITTAESYTVPTNEPLMIVKQKRGGSMPVFKHELDPILDIKDLPPRKIKYAYENPVRIFEDYPALKEVLYDPMKSAEKNMYIEYKNIKQQIKGWKKGISGKSARRIGAYAIAQQKGGEAILKEMGIKKAPELTPKEMKVYQEGRILFDDLHARINQARDLAGVKPLKYVENYFTWARNLSELRELGLDPVFDMPRAVEYHLNTTPFKYAKPRKYYRGKPVKRPSVALNYFDVMDNYAFTATRHIQKTPIVAKGRALLESFKFQTGKYTKKGTPRTSKWSMRQQYPRLSAWLEEWLDTTAAQKIRPKYFRSAWLEKKAGQLNRNLGMAILSYNVRSALIQPSALRNSYIALGERYLIDGMLRNASPKQRAFAMDASNVLAPRKMDIHVQEIMEAQFTKKLGKIKRDIGTAGIKPLQILDLEAARATWLGAYQKAINHLKLDPRRAIKHADDIVTKTQASAQLSDIAPIQRSVYGKLATLFQTFVINEWNFLSKDVFGFKNPKVTTGQRLMNAYRLALGTAMVNGVFEGLLKIRSPYPAPEWAIIHATEEGKEPKEMAGSALKELAEQLPIIGGTLRWATPYRTPLPAAGQVGVELISSIDKIIFGMAPEKMGRGEIETIGRILGVPGTGQVMKYIRRRRKGMSHAEAIIGIRTDISKKQEAPKKKQKSIWIY